MDMKLDKTENDYQNLITQISTAYSEGQKNSVLAVNSFLVETYWQIGRYIVEFEQDGKAKAVYGKALIDNISRNLTIRFGKGFSKSNLLYMRLFYIEYPKGEKPSHHLNLCGGSAQIYLL